MAFPCSGKVGGMVDHVFALNFTTSENSDETSSLISKARKQCIVKAMISCKFATFPVHFA